MIRQTDIPNIQQGEAVSAGLLDQIIRGANTGRMITGDESAAVTSIRGSIGVTDLREQPNSDAAVLVEVIARTGNETINMSVTSTSGSSQVVSQIMPGAMYQGKIFNQPFVQIANDETAHALTRSTFRPICVPDVHTCWVINLRECDQRQSTASQSVQNYGTCLILQNIMTTGRRIGFWNGAPLIAVEVEVFKPCLVTITGTLTQGGAYKGSMILGNAGMVPDGGASTNPAWLGFTATSSRLTNCMVVNLQELSQATHDLAATRSNPTFLGMISGQVDRSAGTTNSPIVIIDSSQWSNCTT